MNGPNENDNRNNRNNDGLWTAGAAVAGAAAIAGGIYWLSRGTQQENQERTDSQSSDAQKQAKRTRDRHTRAATENTSSGTSWASYLTDFIQKITVEETASEEPKMRPNAPRNPVITNLNSLLADIFVRYIQLNPSDFRLHYRVFDRIFQDLHSKMKEVDPYYRRYSSTVQFAGSHYDNLRIKNPDEFDMDIIIDLPLNLSVNRANPSASDIVIEPKSAGYVHLRMGEQFQKLPMRDGNDWQINKSAYSWSDENKFLLRSNFLDWFKGVVDRALNLSRVNIMMPPTYNVDGVQYTVGKTESGPAVTLIIKNTSRSFKMDVDLVPALKFPEDRWPIGPSYRPIPDNCKKGVFMVVGKPNKAAPNDYERNRSWRLALHNQERELLHDSQHLRQTIRLIKQLRDAQGMKEIASYYIKTIFFWEILQRNDGFWSCNNPATLFKIMVKRFHEVLVEGKIPYFWNKSNNLIGHVGRSTLNQYAARLVPLISILDSESPFNQDYKMVAKFLLTPQEYSEYRIILNV